MKPSEIYPLIQWIIVERMWGQNKQIGCAVKRKCKI